MQLRPRPVLVAAILLLAGLGWLARPAEPMAVALGQAALFEGQGPIQVGGVVTSVHTEPGAAPRTFLTLAQGGDGLRVSVPGTSNVTTGQWVQAQGRVLRSGGELLLLAQLPEDVRAAAGPDPAQPSWEQVAQAPTSWHGVRIVLSGTVERGTLGDRDGHRVAVGAGPWPKAGPVQATGVLHYTPACLCERFDAARVTAV